jgi:hypothetical protein
MPAFTGNHHVQHQAESIATTVNTATPKVASWGAQYAGNPQTIEFVVPLGFFFTKHPSMYLPIAAIAASQDITIEVRLRDIASLMTHYHSLGDAGGAGTNVTAVQAYKMTAYPQSSTKANFYPSAFPEILDMQLWCHHIQLSASEADALAAKPQHVRLIKQVQSNLNTTITMPGTIDGSYTTLLDKKFDLSFLHPCQTIWVAIRDPDDIANNNYFRYIGKPDDDCRITAWDFVINGQSRMPQKTSADYSMLRLQPMFQNHPVRSYGSDEQSPILSIDFALNGQSSNPSGHINLSNAATQQLKLDFSGLSGKTYRVDIYAVSLNWVNISGGSARITFN